MTANVVELRAGIAASGRVHQPGDRSLAEVYALGFWDGVRAADEDPCELASPTVAADILQDAALPHSVTELVRVVAAELPDGYLGLYTAGAGGHTIWVHRRCDAAQRVETVLHEVFHFLCGHVGAVTRTHEDAIEELCIRVAGELARLAIRRA